MKMLKRVLVFMLVAVLLLSIPAAQAKTYKASKVTAKQIVTELKKTTGLIKKVSKADVDASQYKLPNGFKSKYNFTDKKYKDVYCSIEVFRDTYDAVRRQSQLDALEVIYRLFDMDEDVPLGSMRYKNVIIRISKDMPVDYGLKYYKALKKIVK